MGRRRCVKPNPNAVAPSKFRVSPTNDTARPTPPVARPRGVAIIIVYKLTKALAQIVIAAILAIFTWLGLAARLQDFARDVREEFAGAWSMTLAHAIASASNHLWFVTFALAFDGVLSSIEGWALYRGFGFAPWLVVVTTSALLPFEAVHLARSVRPTRIALFAINLGIVVYLGRRAMKHRDA